MNTGHLELERILRAADPTDHAAQTVARAHTTRLQVGNTLLDFDGPLDATVVNQMLELLGEAGVDECTVLSAYSNMADAFYAIQQGGWKVTGMRMISSAHRDWETGAYEHVPAWHFQHARPA